MKYWATEAKPFMTTNLWSGRRRLSEFEGEFPEGTEVLISKGDPDKRWLYDLYLVIDGKLKKQKDRGAMNLGFKN